MSIKLLIDMNLSPRWAIVLQAHGWSAVHWSTVGDPRAADQTIMAWARAHQHVVFTHDLDFPIILALTHAQGPSVLQVRVQNVFPEALAPTVLAALAQHQEDLAAGALVIVGENRNRVRVLPL